MIITGMNELMLASSLAHLSLVHFFLFSFFPFFFLFGRDRVFAYFYFTSILLKQFWDIPKYSHKGVFISII